MAKNNPFKGTLFGFLDPNQKPYEERLVERDEFGWGYISTCQVIDGFRPYETAICHNEYVDWNGKTDNMIVVEAYDSFEEACNGHARWKKIMTSTPLPEALIDCVNCESAKWLHERGMTPTENRKASKNETEKRGN